jgi:mono/diheme cytochrome c family protein
MRPDGLTLTVGAVVLAGAGVLLWNVANPPAGGHSMVPPDTSGIAEGAPIVQVALPETLGELETIGKRAYEGVCAACHGVNAAGQNGVAPPLVHITYEPGHHGDESFWRATQMGVQAHHWQFGNMPAIEGLTRADVKAITAYIRALQRENGIG